MGNGWCPNIEWRKGKKLRGEIQGLALVTSVSNAFGTHRLTYSLVGADLQPAQCAALTTWFITFPMEADAYAMRFWVGNVLPTPYCLGAAAFSASDSYGDYVNPTNGTGWRAVTFNGRGADLDEIDPPGGARDATVPSAQDEGDIAASYRPYFSDWVSCTPVAPREGTARVGMLRIAMPAQAYSQIAAWRHPERQTAGWRRDQPGRWTANASVHRGRDYAILALEHDDRATDPTPVDVGSVRALGHGPVVGMQYLSRSRGVVIASSGDSIAGGTGSSGGVNDFVTQACAALSTPARPVVPFKATWGGKAHEHYLRQCQSALAQRPTILHLQGFSRNGWNGTYDAWASQFAHVLRVAEDAADIGCRVIISTGAPGGLNATQLTVYNNRIYRELKEAVLPPYSLFDTAQLVCDTAGRFRAGFSDDGEHPNDAGHAALSHGFEIILDALGCGTRDSSASAVPSPQPQTEVPAMTTYVQQTIDFGLSGNAQPHLVSGWSDPEPNGRWSVGAASAIGIPRPDAEFGFFLEVDFVPNILFPYRSSQTLAIECDGRGTGVFTIDRPGIFAFFIPPMPSNDSGMTIRFIHPTCFRPCDFGSGKDRRDLAFKFLSVRVLVLKTAFQVVRRPASNIQIKSIINDAIVEEAERATGLPIKDLFGNFEAIAGNCDMGLALRDIGYEWLSLLRFAGATPAVAIRGLESNFAGIGEDIRAEIADNPIKEWMVSDAAGLRFHSGQSSLTVPEAELLKRFPRYAARLRTKLLEDLDDSKKIFVFADHRDMNSVRSLDYVMPLYLALRRRSSSPLLWVCPSRNSLDFKGSVREVLPGLAIAELDLTAPPVLIGGGITVTGWVTVLCNAWNALK